MKKSLIAFFTTVIFGVIAMLIDSNIGFDGNLSVVISIATIGTFIYHSNIKNK